MNYDQKLQNDVEQALNLEPLLGNVAIGVISCDGIITLAGTVDSYAKKRMAEFVAQTVNGVKAIIDELQIKYTIS